MVLVSFHGAAGAQSGACTDDPRECGKREFEEGIAAFQSGRFADAAARFRAALSYKNHPTIEFNLALAEAELGHFVAAVRHFTSVIDRPESPEETVVRARAERSSAEAKIATVALDASSGAGHLEVDGATYEGPEPQVRLDPGEHHVRVISQGRVTVDRRIVLAPGERVRLSVSREREIVNATGPAPPPSPPPPPRDQPSGLSPTWVWVGAGATAVLGGVTIWSAIDTQRDFSDFQEQLDARRLSQRQADGRVDDGKARELRTNVLLGATAVLGVTTVALAAFAVSWGSGEARVGVTPGGAELVGRF